MIIREATAADRDAILALRTRCFGDVDPEKCDPQFWTWQFANGRAFVGEENGTLLTHLGFMPLPNSALAVDAMTAPEARGKGAFSRLVAETRNAFPFATAYQIRDAVLGAMLRGGWRVASRVPVLVRPSLRFLVGRASARQTAPEAGLKPGLRRDNVDVMARISNRPAEWLAWRFFDNPRWTYRVTAIDDRAYLVTRRTTLKGYDTLAIADLAFTDRKAARLLIRDAIAESKRLGCTFTAALCSPRHPAFVPLLLSGFMPGPHWFRLLVNNDRKETWRVMWGDTDHL